MTYEEKLRFLQSIRENVEEDPSLISEINGAIQNGVNRAIDMERRRATDMETIAMAFATMSKNKRYDKTTHDWAEKVIAGKLEKWKHLNAFDWGE